MNLKTTGRGRLLVSILLLLAVILSACSTPTTPPPPTPTPEPATETPEPVPTGPDYSSVPFVGKTWYWLSTQFNNDTRIQIEDPSIYMVQFNADGTFTGTADCNNFLGEYSVDGSSIDIMVGPMTLVACPEGSQSDAFIQQLNDAVIFLLQEGFLYLDLPVDTGTMKLSELPAPEFVEPVMSDQPFVGQVWQWIRFDSSDGSTTVVPNPPVYLLQFFADGTFAGVADCNNFNGSYTADGASLKLQVGAVTLAACPPESLSDTYLQRLGETATYVIENGFLYLNLQFDSGNLVFSELPQAVLPEPAAGTPTATANTYNFARSGPGEAYPVAGIMTPGLVAEVVGKSEDGAWWALNSPTVPLGRVWVSGDFVNASGAESVALLPAPPLPPTIVFSTPLAGDPQVTAFEVDYVRSGPGDGYPVHSISQVGAKGLVIGKNPEGTFWVVRMDPAQVSAGFAWVANTYVVAENVKDVPVVDAPPLPPEVALQTPPAGSPSGVAMAAVSVRGGPGQTFPVLGVAPAGSVGEITGKSADGNWWQVRVPNTVSSDGFGWVQAALFAASNAENVPVASAPTSGAAATPIPTSVVVATSPPTSGGGTGGMVRVGTTTDTVNLRAGPGNQYDSYGVLSAGTQGVIIDQNAQGTWYAFQVSRSIAADGKGWVSAAYVRVTTVNVATATAMATKPISVPGSTSTPGGTVTNACKIVELKPASGTVYKPNFEFDMKVTLENTGNSDWDPNQVDVKFISAVNNVKVHTTVDLFDLPELVKPDGQITIYVDMKAPAQEGSYGESWALVKGGTVLCQWSFTFTVQKP